MSSKKTPVSWLRQIPIDNLMWKTNGFIITINSRYAPWTGFL